LLFGGGGSEYRVESGGGIFMIPFSTLSISFLIIGQSLYVISYAGFISAR
jgi:hypothetical protein